MRAALRTALLLGSSGPPHAAVTGASLLLAGETNGMASDFTVAGGLGAVSVKDTATPGNVVTNVAADAWWGNAGTSPKLVTGSDGVLKWAPHNLFLNSAAPATQNVTTIVGATYTVTVTGAGGGSLTGSDGAAGVATTGSPLTYVATTTTSTFTYATTLTTIQINRGPVATTYMATTGAIKIGLAIDYANSSYGLLVEPAATNVCLQSQDLATTWTPGETTISANAIAAPDGTLTADKLVESVNTANHRIFQGITLTSGVAYTFSVYAKAAGRSWITLDFVSDGATDSQVFFDLTNGVVGTTAGGSAATITAVGNGWYRCTHTRTTSATSDFVEFFLSTDGSTISYAGDITKGVYFWGAQVELGSVATSPIPTFAATVTRGRDYITKVCSAFPVGIIMSMLANGTTNRNGDYQNLSCINTNADRTDEICIRKANTDVRQASVTGASLGNGAAWAIATYSKLAVRSKLNDFALAADGTVVSTDTSGTAATVGGATHKIVLGNDTASQAPNGNVRIRSLIVVPRGWTDAELQTLTT